MSMRLMSKTRTILPGLLVVVLSTSQVAPLVAADAIPVRTQSFAELAIFPQQSAPATVVSDNQSRLSAEVQTRILDIPVRVGNSVSKGTLLARLDKKDFELALKREMAALAALKARLDLAEYEFNRARSLSKKQAVSEQLLRQREAERDALLAEREERQIAVAQAQRQLDKTDIHAPFNAVVLERLGQIGELANPGTPLLRIVDTDHLELAAKLSSDQAEALRQSVQSINPADKTPEHVTGNATLAFINGEQRYPVTLRVITPALDTQARTQEARLQFGGDRPLPGTTGQLIWTPAQASLPAELISQRQGKLGVFVESQQKARFIELPRAETGRPAMVTLDANTTIITDGRFRLRDGDAIQLQ
jgi:RND family efflux transporter MFP subunit